MKFLREGCYAVYKGKEYKASISPDLKDKDIAMLITDDTCEIYNGFSNGFYGITKKVRIDELDTAYYFKVYAFYMGCQLQASVVDKYGKVLLGTSSWEISQQLNMEQTDKYYFNKLVYKSEIEKMWEVKEYIWGFPHRKSLTSSKPSLRLYQSRLWKVLLCIKRCILTNKKII